MSIPRCSHDFRGSDTYIVLFLLLQPGFGWRRGLARSRVHLELRIPRTALGAFCKKLFNGGRAPGPIQITLMIFEFLAVFPLTLNDGHSPVLYDHLMISQAILGYQEHQR